MMVVGVNKEVVAVVVRRGGEGGVGNPEGG